MAASLMPSCRARFGAGGPRVRVASGWDHTECGDCQAFGRDQLPCRGLGSCNEATARRAPQRHVMPEDGARRCQAIVGTSGLRVALGVQGEEMNGSTPKPGVATPCGGPGLPMMEKGSDSSSTLATLSESNITIGGKQTSAAEPGINTDASGAHPAVDALPDASKLLAASRRWRLRRGWRWPPASR